MDGWINTIIPDNLPPQLCPLTGEKLKQCLSLFKARESSRSPNHFWIFQSNSEAPNLIWYFELVQKFIWRNDLVKSFESNHSFVALHIPNSKYENDKKTESGNIATEIYSNMPYISADSCTASVLRSMKYEKSGGEMETSQSTTLLYCAQWKLGIIEFIHSYKPFIFMEQMIYAGKAISRYKFPITGVSDTVIWCRNYTE